MTKSTMETQIAAPETTDPWSEFDRLFDDLRLRVYGSFGVTPWSLSGVPSPEAEPVRLRAAPADIVDLGGAYRIVAELPGIPKEALEVTIRGPTVEIKGEHAPEKEGAPAGEVLHRERTYRGFYRSFELPEPVVAKDATAKLVNGLLELDLPKEHPTAGPGEIKVPVQ